MQGIYNLYFIAGPVLFHRGTTWSITVLFGSGRRRSILGDPSPVVVTSVVSIVL